MNFIFKESKSETFFFLGDGWGGGARVSDFFFFFLQRILIKTRKSVHRTRMPPPNAIQKKGLYVTVTGIP